jgi:low affinity Fe/Cu permease
MKGGDCFMNSRKSIKAIGIAVTIITLSMTLITDWVNGKKMEEKIEEKVLEALAKMNKGEP